MSKFFLISDPHIGHRNVTRFRPTFSSVEEHDETLIDNIRTAVSKRDVLLFGGDVAFSTEALEKIRSIVCLKKILILGNHDTDHVKFSELIGVYDRIYSMWSKRNFLITHCPIHPSEMREHLGCIHGHIHDRVIDDPRYFNISAEQLDYKPITWAELMERRL